MPNFTSNIRKLAGQLNELSLLRGFINTGSLKSNTVFNQSALSNTSKPEEIFLSGLSLNYYNILLTDYSYFQFSTASEANTSLRFAFYPNPFLDHDELSETDEPHSFLIDYDKLWQKGEIDYEEYSQALSEAKPLVRNPNVRYDLSYDQYYKNDKYKRFQHPLAHLHFGISENSRVPVNRILTPLLFGQFIMKTFYSDAWYQDHQDETDMCQFDRHMIEERSKCTELSGKDFCTEQNKLFYMG